ncbi:bifunctional hydroxymethylpyrimidine kinase/phosphomethylpyrimidine kinase [Sphingomonas sp. QA11]|uniref:bifunctional hydroxymethylpyrimidine kinase/phosphomethylpyrimidine kinase n=1 Tax=Sphingomonas sp. QA11 TaxID=2950605 RepID=UPI00234BD42F|nr:bifunctional hydroxymethylpyrimidine kinase/phosphomethylpyrimidine kinase [Sphingomonas sp. QA11]WCM26142.1 bifunctional hydroxymethylpyrimidine kinase/phosphomethylpyrimidine kinase [Sphingomonas sp. QA11]
MTPRILIIAGSDSGGGAGIQADIKAVTMLGGHAMTAITAITAQNTLGVQGVHPVPTDMVLAQIDAVVSDIGVDAVKIGMIGSAETANAVADRLEAMPGASIVFDPVMVATSGAVLSDAATIAAFARLMRIATVTTPNLPELEVLGGEAAVRRATGALLVKGGHGDGDEVVDRLLLADGGEIRWADPRIETRHSHGTGCTLASAIATGLGRGMTLADSVARARVFVRLALREAPGFGGGHGPMGHQAVRLDGDLGGAMLNQITVPLADYEASAAFYRLLGLRQIVESAPRYARFESAGGGTLSIETADEIAGRPVMFFECVDLDAMVVRVREAGIVISDPVAESWGWREARLADPAGNALCLYQAGENRRFPAWRLP